MTNKGTAKRTHSPKKFVKPTRINDRIKAHAERHPNDKTQTVVMIVTERHKRRK